MKKVKPKIYKYNDIIIFLNDLFDFFKNKENKSLRSVAAELKIANGLLPMILNRKRNLTEKVLEKVLNHFNYNKSDIQFAKNLRVIGFSQNYKERKKSITEINKLKNYRSFNKNEFEMYKYLSNWCYVAIKEMTELGDFKEDVGWIQNRLAHAVNQKQIVKALEFLKENKVLIYRNKKLVAANKTMNCEEGIYKLTLGGFHKQIMALAADSIDTIERDKRRILGHTLTINENQISEIHDILAEAFEKIKKINSTEKDDNEVYHVELISIPITKKVKK